MYSLTAANYRAAEMRQGADVSLGGARSILRGIRWRAEARTSASGPQPSQPLTESVDRLEVAAHRPGSRQDRRASAKNATSRTGPGRRKMIGGLVRERQAQRRSVRSRP